METQNLAQDLAFETLKNILRKGGPAKSDYKQLEFSIALIDDLIKKRVVNTSEVDALLDSCKFLSNERSVMGHIKMKPHGYAGDYEIIERIYQEKILEKSFHKWDKYSLQHTAAAAVRNRKKYFVNFIKSSFNSTDEINLCNVASGPGRDLLEVYEGLTEDQSLYTTCVDMDCDAIKYAEKLTVKYQQSINFINDNIFRHHAEKKFDIVWSAGLFDYFNDKSFIHLLKRFGTWLKPGGEIVIGNFNEGYNPSRSYMELFGDWYLKHRSEEVLTDLAIKAGYRKENIFLGKEEHNVNLFLHIKL